MNARKAKAKQALLHCKRACFGFSKSLFWFLKEPVLFFKGVGVLFSKQLLIGFF